MEVPVAEIDGCRRAHALLTATVGGLTDDVALRASRLPGWTIGHVLTHLARNAEAMCRRIDASISGELVEQYPGGATGRAAEIESGARRPASKLVADASGWSEQVDERFRQMPDDGWARLVRTVAGGTHPVAMLPLRRWREVEVHLVDLGLGYTAADWSEELVERAVPRLLSDLPDRSDRRQLMAWMLGRGPAPSLDPWG